MAASAWAVGRRRIFGVTGVETGVFLGPPDLKVRDGFGGTGILTRGRGGAVSVTGVGGGRWIESFGGASSAPRTRTSANLRIDHRTSWSVSGELNHISFDNYLQFHRNVRLTGQ